MGGEVLELLNERVERLANEASEKACKQAREQCIEQFAAALRECGVDEAILAKASAALRA